MSARTERIARIEAKMAANPPDLHPLRQLRDHFAGMTDADYDAFIVEQRARFPAPAAEGEQKAP